MSKGEKLSGYDPLATQTLGEPDEDYLETLTPEEATAYLASVGERYSNHGPHTIQGPADYPEEPQKGPQIEKIVYTARFRDKPRNKQIGRFNFGSQVLKSKQERASDLVIAREEESGEIALFTTNEVAALDNVHIQDVPVSLLKPKDIQQTPELDQDNPDLAETISKIKKKATTRVVFSEGKFMFSSKLVNTDN